MLQYQQLANKKIFDEIFYIFSYLKLLYLSLQGVRNSLNSYHVQFSFGFRDSRVYKHMKIICTSKKKNHLYLELQMQEGKNRDRVGKGCHLSCFQPLPMSSTHQAPHSQGLHKVPGEQILSYANTDPTSSSAERPHVCLLPTSASVLPSVEAQVCAEGDSTTCFMSITIGLTPSIPLGRRSHVTSQESLPRE